MTKIDDPLQADMFDQNAIKTVLIGADGVYKTSATNPIQTKAYAWNKTANGTAAVGSNLTLTPVAGTSKTIYELLITTIGSVNDSATLKVYKDSVSAGNLLFDGYLLNLDGNSSILFPDGEACTTSWIVLVTGGSGTVYASARYR